MTQKPTYKAWMKAQGYSKFLGFWSENGRHLTGRELLDKLNEYKRKPVVNQLSMIS